MPDLHIDPDRLMATFLELAHINSPSKHEAAVAERVTAICQGLGAQVLEDSAAERLGGEVGNLVAKLPGTVDAPPLLFNAHLDTVEPTEGLRVRMREHLLTTDGTTILGGDDKAGVAAILEMARAVVASGIPRPPLELVFTVAEEIGVMGSMVLDYALVSAKTGFVCDSGGDAGRIVNRAPAQKNLKFTVHGRAAHAGIAPEQGISAITVAARAIAGMRQGRLDEESTANVGIIRGGKATNIIADTVEVLSEARSRNPEQLLAQVAHMRDCFLQAAQQLGATVDIEEADIYPAFHVAEACPAVDLATRALAELGITPVIEPTGGGSDANFFNNRGIQTVILSCGMISPHCHDERLDIEQWTLLAEQLYQIVRLAGHVTG